MFTVHESSSCSVCVLVVVTVRLPLVECPSHVCDDGQGDGGEEHDGAGHTPAPVIPNHPAGRDPQGGHGDTGGPGQDGQDPLGEGHDWDSLEGWVVGVRAMDSRIRTIPRTNTNSERATIGSITAT